MESPSFSIWPDSRIPIQVFPLSWQRKEGRTPVSIYWSPKWKLLPSNASQREKLRERRPVVQSTEMGWPNGGTEPKAGSNVFCSNPRDQMLGRQPLHLHFHSQGAQSNQVHPCHQDQSLAPKQRPRRYRSSLDSSKYTILFKAWMFWLAITGPWAIKDFVFWRAVRMKCLGVPWMDSGYFLLVSFFCHILLVELQTKRSLLSAAAVVLGLFLF